MRLFIALTLPEGALDDLDTALAPYRAAFGDLRWTSRETWHVTLAFLGEVGEQSAERLLPRLERGARRHPPFELRIAGAGASPKPARATVVWSGIAGNRRALGQLAMTVSAAARRAGAPPPDAATTRTSPWPVPGPARTCAPSWQTWTATRGRRGQPERSASFAARWGASLATRPSAPGS